MATVMITCRLQTFIQFDGELDDDGEHPEFNAKKDEFMNALERMGMVDVESEEPWD